MEMMEQPSSSCSPNPQTSPPSSDWEKHEVFLSFAGDSRYKFTDHLHRTLIKKGFSVFVDSENLQMEKSIVTLEVLEKIDKSKFAVIVCSADYARSSWCLGELAHILERKKLGTTEFLPVFYHIIPALFSEQIRKQKQSYSDAYIKSTMNLKESGTKQIICSKALEYVDSCSKGLSEWATWQVTDERSESIVIQDIFNRISEALRMRIPDWQLIGMDSRIEKIESHLNSTSNDVLTIGIWGMGGIGKTTLALEVLKKIRCQFDLSGFVSHEKPAVDLLKHLCESFLGKDSGTNTLLLKKTLFKKKVLIILDDVYSYKQIEYLAPGGPLGGHIWSGGSRLIVTTRDRSLLRYINVKEEDIYEAEKLSDEEAFQLFCQKAFGHDNPPEYLELSMSFLKYASGLPLAIEVLGSRLFGKNVGEWSEVLHKLDEDPDKNIFRVLHTSFDGLEDTDKKIFLDIACFFNGNDYARVNNILKGCGFSSGIGINNLINKSLLKIEENKIWMHGLLQCLGRHIARTEHKEAGKRSRLWIEEHSDSCDASKVLRDNTGTPAVEGLFLSLPNRGEMSLKADPFLNMRKLRLLKIHNVNFKDVQLGHFSRNLRLLEWHECPLQFLPRDFKSVNLVEIKMPSSSIERLSEISLSLEMLKLMDLSHCQSLATTPDFTTVPNLERLILQGCNKLIGLHRTIGNHQKLKFLDLKGCTSLVSLPEYISLSSLQTFILSGCSNLQNFPEIGENMHRLSELHLDGTAISEVPESVQHLKGLIRLNLSGCKNLLSLPSIVCSNLTSLKFLYLSMCTSMNNLPDNIGCLERLEEFDACETAIKEVPESISLLKNLKLLCFHGCSSGLTGLRLPRKLSGLWSLTTLNLGGCNLREGAIPDDIGDLKSLQSLDLSENNFSTIPESISQLSELTEISLFKCSKLRSLPKDIPSSLRNVNVSVCPMLTDFSSGWGRYPPLKGWSIPNCCKPESEESCLALHELPLQSSSSFQTEVPFDWEHDLFLNFRGEEPHSDFPDHLYEALCGRGIDVFRDLDKLQMGNSTAQENLKAIEESQCAIIIFSPLYPTSTWCLDELVRIHGCKKVTGLRVIPVFYHVEPSEVRQQTGKYENAFSNHESIFSDEKVKGWRQALKEIANVPGWYVKKTDNDSVDNGWYVKKTDNDSVDNGWLKSVLTDSIRHVMDRNESEVIEEITEWISEILRSSHPRRGLTGMGTHVQTLVSYLNLGSEELRIIGVLGKGAISKTTLAREVYREICGQFHTSGFVCNVRLQSETELHKLLFESLSGDGDVGTVEKGSKWTRLSKKKVLLVLDDVGGKQIKQLAPGGSIGAGNVFGPGSRLIVTSKDRRTLTELGIAEDKIYKVGKQSDEEVSQLLCPTVFKNVNLPEESINSKSFLTASALPSAHEVLWSYLNADEFSEVRLDKDPHIDILCVNRYDDQEYLNKPHATLPSVVPSEVLVFLVIQIFYLIYRNHYHHWSASLASMYQKYFSDPWPIISFLVAVALFGMLIGAFYWMYSYYYYDHRWNSWCASLKHKFFNNPWAVLIFLAAVVYIQFPHYSL